MLHLLLGTTGDRDKLSNMNTWLHSHVIQEYMDMYAISRMYSEYLLICHDSFQKVWLINELGGLTRCTLLIVDYMKLGTWGE